MLNAGLSTLDYLKSRIFPDAEQDADDWDPALVKLGLAIAGRMEAYCARGFARTVGAVDEFVALTPAVVLRRYPVEGITSLQVRDWNAVLTDVEEYQLDAGCGIVNFLSYPGSRQERLVITYTGGWWLDDGGEMPEGATALPDDLLEAFVSEVQWHAEERGLFGAVGLRAKKDKDKAGAANGLTEECMAALAPYRRFAGE